IAICDVQIDEPPLLSCSASMLKEVDCFGESNASAEVIITGGTPAYAVSWDNGETTVTASNLDYGIHVVTVTDFQNCTSSCSVSISQPDLLVCDVSKVRDVLCNGGATAIADVNVSGGVGPYSYQWDNGETTKSAIELTEGLRSVTVTDNRGCSTSCDIMITEPPVLSCVLSVVTNVSCNGGNDGQASIQAFGGTAPYAYDWGTANPNSLSAGTYTVTATDSNGCTSTCSVSIGEPSQLVCVINKIKDASCYQAADGTVDYYALGGEAPYTYDWGNANPKALDAGSHVLTVTDANGCVSSCEMVISEPPNLNCSASLVKNVDCFGEENGIAELSISGGTPGYSILWDNGESLANASKLDFGMHTVTVTDDHACIASCSVFIPQPDVLVCDINKIHDVLCYGGSSGKADAVVTGGTGPYEYAWDNGESGLRASKLKKGISSVTVTDINGCTTECAIEIDEPEPLGVIPYITNVACFGDNSGSIYLEVTGGVGPYEINWSNGNDGELLSNLYSGNYSVTVVDNNGCSIGEAYGSAQPEPLRVNPVDATICLDHPILLQSNASGGSGLYYKKEWSIIDYGTTGGTAAFVNNDNLLEDPVFNSVGLLPGTIVFQSKVTDDAGCKTTAIMSLTLEHCFDLALKKTVVGDNVVQNGELVEFKVDIYNQGRVDAFDIIVEDRPQTELLFFPEFNTTDLTGNPHDWILDADNKIVTEIDSLGPEEAHQLTIFLQVDPNNRAATLRNDAEIIKFNSRYKEDPLDEDDFPDDFEDQEEKDDDVEDDQNGGDDNPNDDDHLDGVSLIGCQYYDHLTVYEYCPY
ncbi:MAG: SprB repeat-containing protein, partial [Bacteroidia bacterium]|nr:SprB repeat-containing protein [Bacteroidia bacterium]